MLEARYALVFSPRYPFLIGAHRRIPGGILLVVEGDLQLYGEDHEPMQAKFPPEPSGSWMNRLLFGEGFSIYPLWHADSLSISFSAVYF